MNNILKLFVGSVMAVSAVTCCVADDADTADVSLSKAPTVTARMDCKTLKAKIDELSANGKSDELSRFQLQYRKDCVVRASGLRSSSRGGALSIADASANATQTVPVETVADEVTDTKSVTAAPEIAETDDSQAGRCERLSMAIDTASDDMKEDIQALIDKYCGDNVAENAAAEPVETDEEKYARMAENLDAGLCPDGTAPNKFGCCGDEKFTDLGNLEFACCPKEGDCFPPVK